MELPAVCMSILNNQELFCCMSCYYFFFFNKPSVLLKIVITKYFVPLSCCFFPSRPLFPFHNNIVCELKKKLMFYLLTVFSCNMFVELAGLLPKVQEYVYTSSLTIVS